MKKIRNLKNELVKMKNKGDSIKIKDRQGVTMGYAQQFGFKTVFYGSLRTTLLMFKIFGLLPIEGLFNSNSSRTRFTFKSPYTLVYLTGLTIQCAHLVITYWDQIIKGSILQYSAGILTASTSAVVWIASFRLCVNWRSVTSKVERIELLLPPLRSYNVILNRINWFVAIILIIASFEHFIYIWYMIFIVKQCFVQDNDSGWYLKSYLLFTHNAAYSFVPFSYTSGVIIQIINYQTAIICNLADILVVVCSVYLSVRFKNFYRILVQTIKNRAGGQVPWHELQTHYTHLTALVSTVDHLIGPFTLTAFLSHMLLICKEINDIIRKKHIFDRRQSAECVSSFDDDPVTYVYVAVSLAVLLLRSTLVSLMTAYLHTLSRKPLNALHTISDSVYDENMQKFIDQVYHSKICLSGLQFFYVTRGTVLSMISTTLTYELMLLQIPED